MGDPPALRRLHDYPAAARRSEVGRGEIFVDVGLSAAFWCAVRQKSTRGATFVPNG
jgi:hypothetical protein